MRRCLAALAACALSACQARVPVDVAPDGGDAHVGAPPDAGGEAPAACAQVLSGSGTEVLGGLTRPRRLAVDGAALYVSEAGTANPDSRTGRLLRLPLDGGTPEVLLEALPAPDAVVARDGTVFLVHAEGLERLAPGAAGPQVLDTSLNGAVGGQTTLLLEGDTLVLATGHRALVRLGTDGAGRQVLHQAPAGAAVRGAVRVGADVLFFVVGTEAAGLYRVPLDGSAPAERLDATLTDGTSLRALPDGLLLTLGRGDVLLRHGDGSRTLLASGLASPVRPVLHAGVLYVPTARAGSDFLRAIPLCAPEQATWTGGAGVGPGEALSLGSTLSFTSAASGGEGRLSSLSFPEAT